ncbi:MAG: hypothetical protein KZQ99_17605 [Candidatus Thiodiazotropha sp. (ex Dulcina madagascariensis)]|nr:hypothetical protein [Candidatus Thiodiazotropha sp. (ex Dulcina madagascariensis)]MCU7928356.1 hypothetical protein [Candidatus Thiodiazotropha sp. (ex Dulcina madagascariensis)]MCU7936665.1 hypothetical protein [Candidatus Thiodiazotropha sp. (ex Dulcina madagascariensis)]
MSISNDLQKIISIGFSDEESLIKQEDIERIEASAQKLSGVSPENKGYTIPQLDTIGMNLYGKFSCQIKDA